MVWTGPMLHSFQIFLSKMNWNQSNWGNIYEKYALCKIEFMAKNHNLKKYAVHQRNNTRARRSGFPLPKLILE